jgi:carbon-monoxide dehydrogenase large subunit
MTDIRTQMIGRPLRRREDAALVTGRATYTDDVALDAPLYLAFLRSPVARARIRGIDPAAALELPGVHAVNTAADLGATSVLSVNTVMPMLRALPFPVLARETLECVGQPVAVALAATPALAQSAVEAIDLDYDELAMPEPERIAQKSWRTGDTARAFAEAATIVEVEIRHPRLAPSPMEPRAIAIRYDAKTDSATIYQSTQTPHRSRSEFAKILQVDPDRLRVIAPAVGGAFGMKGSVYPEEVFAVWAALHHRRDVKWTATRSDDFLSATHGRALVTRGRLALDAEGRFTALEARATAPVGPWLPNSALVPAWNAARILPSAYDIPNVALQAEVESHALPPVGIYRGAGRPEANTLIERLIDEAARRTGRDPLALRRGNLLPPGAMPHRTLTGDVLDSGDYPALLEAASGPYTGLCAERDAMRGAGRIAGVGLAFCLEPSGAGWESARVTLRADGSVLVASGSSSQGQGRETSYAQIAADALGVAAERIEVLAGDTGVCPEGIGALASRSTSIGGSAVLEACREAATRRDDGEPLPIMVETRYDNLGQAWGAGAYLALVEIDAESGAMTVLKAHATSDAGLIVNPLLVEGQMQGGFAQGLGEAVMENLVLDDTGQLLTGSFMDYAMPRASDVPQLTLAKMTTPSPTNSLGAKGVGEAGTIGGPIAILNAAHDALSPLGAGALQMPLTPARIWRAMQDAGEGNTQ